jgi:glycosyltransferase involved in cell wall biosynthesis
MAASPKISIITVTFNPGPALGRTLQSIASQDYPDIELIVVDGGSTDGTTDLLGESSLVTRWISEPDKGIYDAMNKGMKMATGDYITFLNAGDCYTGAEVLGRLFSGIRDSLPDLVYGDVILLWDEAGRKTYQESLPFTRENLLRYTTQVVCHQSLFLKREIAPEYDIRWRYKGEFNWYFDILDRKPDLQIRYIPIPVVAYPASGTGQAHFWANFMEMIKIVKERHGFRALVKYNYLMIFFLKLFYRLQWRRPEYN